MSSTDRPSQMPERVWLEPYDDDGIFTARSFDEGHGDPPYRLDDPADPLVRMSEVERVAIRAAERAWAASAEGHNAEHGPDDDEERAIINDAVAFSLDRIRRNLHQPTEDLQPPSITEHDAGDEHR